MSNIPILIGNNLNEGNIFTYDEFHSTNISLSMIESALNTWVLPPYVTHNRTQVREVFSSYESNNIYLYMNFNRKKQFTFIVLFLFFQRLGIRPEIGSKR